MELLVAGKFTDKDLKELERALAPKNIPVYRYMIKGVDVGELVRLFFRDLNAYTWLRDGVLFELMLFGVKRAHDWVKGKRGEDANISTGFELIFETRKKGCAVNIGIPGDSKKFWAELEKTLTAKFIESIEDRKIVNIMWDTEDKKIKISQL